MLLGCAGLAPATAWAQAAAQPTQAAPGAGSGWTPKTQTAPSVAATTYDEKQVVTIKKVSTYFNELDNLKGIFVQTGADNKKMRGKFYVKRPGRFRFDYAAPSKMLILSDGNYLSIHDPDKGGSDTDVISLDNTVFRVLLRNDVDILRDAKVLEVMEAEDLIILALQDKSGDASGKIRLFLSKGATLELKEWVTTDAQGLDTRMELSNLVRGEEIDAKLFKPPPMTLRPPSGG